MKLAKFQLVETTSFPPLEVLTIIKYEYLFSSLFIFSFYLISYLRTLEAAN